MMTLKEVPTICFYEEILRAKNNPRIIKYSPEPGPQTVWEYSLTLFSFLIQFSHFAFNEMFDVV